MDAKKCDRCGKFYVRKERKVDNAVDIFNKKVYKVELTYRDVGSDCSIAVDLCPYCMNDLKNFFEQPSVITE